jgi:hypothetical protein
MRIAVTLRVNRYHIERHASSGMVGEVGEGTHARNAAGRSESGKRADRRSCGKAHYNLFVAWPFEPDTFARNADCLLWSLSQSWARLVESCRRLSKGQ